MRNSLKPAIAATSLLTVLAACSSAPDHATSSSAAQSSPPASSPAASSAATPVSSTSSGPSAAASSGASAAASQTMECSYEKFGQAAKPVDPPAKQAATTGTLSVTVKTSDGPITIAMDRAKAPCTVNSFESLARQKYYDGVRCHRLVLSGIFVLQCGDPTGKGMGGPGYRYQDELDAAKGLPAGTGQGVLYPAGSVAMANAGPGTNGSQFFFVFKDTPLPPAYTLFGQMDKAGLGVVTQIADMGVKAGTESEPIAKATIESVSLG